MVDLEFVANMSVSPILSPSYYYMSPLHMHKLNGLMSTTLFWMIKDSHSSNLLHSLFLCLRSREPRDWRRLQGLFERCSVRLTCLETSKMQVSPHFETDSAIWLPLYKSCWLGITCGQKSRKMYTHMILPIQGKYWLVIIPSYVGSRCVVLGKWLGSGPIGSWPSRAMIVI